MTWHYVKLKFTTPVHFGADEAGIGIEAVQPCLHSDTIFSALCNAWAKFRIVSDNDLSQLKQCFDTAPPFKISSAFPYYRSGAPLKYLLPRPMLATRQFDYFGNEMRPEQMSQWKKQLKQAQFIPSVYFEKWLQPDQFIQEGWLDELNDWKSILIEEIRPKHAQDRLTQASEIYHYGQLFFEQEYDCGLYFMVQLYEDSWKNWLNSGLTALSDMGFGGERNLGMGRFACDDNDKGVLLPINNRHPLFFLTKNMPAEHNCTLSLFYPTHSEIKLIKNALNNKNDIIAYALLKRKGWTYSTSTLLQMKRQTVNMFQEGSVFGIENLTPQGTILDVKPDNFPHPVWRYGIALSVPLNGSLN